PAATAKAGGTGILVPPVGPGSVVYFGTGWDDLADSGLRGSAVSTESSRTFTPGPSPNTVRATDGRVLAVPGGWVLLPPGNAVLTRRVKEAGEHWVVQQKKGRKVFSRGVWAPAATVERLRAELAAERATAGYAKRKDAAARRRDRVQAEYVEDFF